MKRNFATPGAASVVSAAIVNEPVAAAGRKLFHFPQRINSFPVAVDGIHVTEVVECSFDDFVAHLALRAGNVGVQDTGAFGGYLNGLHVVEIPADWTLQPSGVSPFQLLLTTGEGQPVARMYYKDHEGGLQCMPFEQPAGEVKKVGLVH